VRGPPAGEEGDHAAELEAGDLRYLAWAMVAVAALFLPSLFVVDSLGWLWTALAGLQLGRMVALLARWRTPHWEVVGAR